MSRQAQTIGRGARSDTGLDGPDPFRVTELSDRERDYWRRAVEAERERLERYAATPLADERHGLH